MHRALQTLARGNPPPDAVSLAAALRQEGLTAACGRGPGGGNSGRTRGLPGGPLPYLPPGPGYPLGGQRVAPGRPTPAGRHPPGGHRPPGLRRQRLVAPGLTRPPAPPPGKTGKPSSPGRPRSTAPNSWPTGRWRPRPRGLNRRRPSDWESISPPAGRWWRCKVFGY